MPIPLTAKPYDWTPSCLAEIEGAPVFTFRTGTLEDKHTFQFQCDVEGLVRYSVPEMRRSIIDELRRGWTSADMAHNITRLEAYWNALDELEAANTEYMRQCRDILAETPDGENPVLPPAPVLDFPEDEAGDLDVIVDTVRNSSAKLKWMNACNNRHSAQYPRVLLRILLKKTTLDVELARAAGIIESHACEELIEALEAFSAEHKIERGLASLELLIEAQMALALRKDEEKNSSAPRSGDTAPKISGRGTSKSRSSARSNSRANSAKGTGKASSA